MLSARLAVSGSAVRQRHRTALTSAVGAMDAAQGLLATDGESALVARELHAAMFAMNSIIGQVGVEDLLDEIFASFCLGK